MMELLTILPLAAAGEIFGLLVTLAILGIGALNQWLSKQAEGRQREAARQRRQAEGGQPPRPRTPEDAVEEFLRRARAEQEDDVVPVEVVEVETVSESGSSISDHVQSYFADNTPERDLVSVDNADEQMADHLHDAFDHDLGQFDHDQSQAARQQIRGLTADTLMGMLRSPQGITSAVILHEILERPTFDD